MRGRDLPTEARRSLAGGAAAVLALVACLPLTWNAQDDAPATGFDVLGDGPLGAGCAVVLFAAVAVAGAAAVRRRAAALWLTVGATGGAMLALGVLARAISRHVVRSWGYADPGGATDGQFVEWETHGRPGPGLWLALAVTALPLALTITGRSRRQAEAGQAFGGRDDDAAGRVDHHSGDRSPQVDDQRILRGREAVHDGPDA